MRAQNKKKKNSPAKITPDVLQNLQAALNDSIKPDFKEKGKDATKKRRKNRKKPQKEK
jgi:hypothetical protein